jgi:hypothetical protein
VSNDQQFAFWCLLVGSILTILFIATRLPIVRRFLARQLRRFGAWVWERVRPEPEVDQMALDLYRVVRREKLRADVERLRRLLATDMSMSATRQLGNRLAYEWLLRELESVRGPSQFLAQEGVFETWSASALPAQTSDLRSSYASPSTTTVEILELGWRR